MTCDFCLKNTFKVETILGGTWGECSECRHFDLSLDLDEVCVEEQQDKDE